MLGPTKADRSVFRPDGSLALFPPEYDRKPRRDRKREPADGTPSIRAAGPLPGLASSLAGLNVTQGATASRGKPHPSRALSRNRHRFAWPFRHRND
jgi:hypothetical protein